MEKEITVKELEDLCARAFAKKQEIEAQEEVVSKLKAEMEEMKAKLTQHLNDFDKTSYESAFGKIYTSQIMTVPIPKTPESKKEFFEYLKDKGLDNMITVNSQTLNSWYRTEYKLAQEEGNINFKIPGLEEPFVKQTISFRKK